jgi:CRISPR-associated Csx10 family RAMP protein
VKGEEEDDERHGVRDSLLDWAVFELASKANGSIDIAMLLTPLEKHKKCPTCGKPMDHFPGFYRCSNLDGRMMKASADTRLQTHTGINRSTGTVQEGILYNRQVFEEHMRFWGLVKLPDELAPIFRGFIEQVGLTGLVRIGTGRTRGLGKVYLSIDSVEDGHDRFSQFKERLETFNDTLHRLAEQTFPANKYNLSLKPFYFALTLHSPVILCDHLLRYRGSIGEIALEEQLNIPADNFKLIYQAASSRQVTGWNELWGTPRMSEYAIDTGSVFLFASTIEPSGTFWQALFKLEEEGIGRRKAEGFGRVCVSDPFHLEVMLS